MFYCYPDRDSFCQSWRQHIRHFILIVVHYRVIEEERKQRRVENVKQTTYFAPPLGISDESRKKKKVDKKNPWPQLDDSASKWFLVIKEWGCWLLVSFSRSLARSLALPTRQFLSALCCRPLWAVTAGNIIHFRANSCVPC